MNAVHIHLLLNHFPIIGTLIGVALLAWGILRKHDILRFAGAILIAVMALITIPVNKSGEDAEETVEHIQGVNEEMLEEHEEAAEFAMYFMMLTGALAAGALVLDKRKHSKTGLAYIVVLLVSAFTSTVVIRTGYLGGQIRHTEINGGAGTEHQHNEHEEDHNH